MNPRTSQIMKSAVAFSLLMIGSISYAQEPTYGPPGEVDSLASTCIAVKNPFRVPISFWIGRDLRHLSPHSVRPGDMVEADCTTIQEDDAIVEGQCYLTFGRGLGTISVEPKTRYEIKSDGRRYYLHEL